MDGEAVAGIEQAFGTLEVLSLHLDSGPLATEWVAWVPREANKAADWLATRALNSEVDAWYWHRSWRRYQDSDVVVLSDAGVRCQEDGVVAIGLGWVMLQRESKQVIAAASWILRAEGGYGAEDVNRWELRAALAGMGALVFLRSGRVGEVWQGGAVPGVVLTAAERRRIKELACTTRRDLEGRGEGERQE